MQGFFVTGTDAGVGKSVVSAALLHRLRSIGPTLYWKPVRDTPPERDELAGAFVRDEASTAVDGTTFSSSQDVIERLRRQPTETRVIIEGPAGVLTPLTERELAADLMWWLRLPVILVGRGDRTEVSRILLSLEAMKSRGIGVIGVVLRGDTNAETIAALERHGHVAMLGLLPELTPLTAAAVQDWSRNELDPRGIIEGFMR